MINYELRITNVGQRRLSLSKDFKKFSKKLKKGVDDFGNVFYILQNAKYIIGPIGPSDETPSMRKEPQRSTGHKSRRGLSLNFGENW